MHICLLDKKEILLFHIKRINPLGAGDTCSGVFTMKYIELKDFVQAYRYGLAAASASCLFTNNIAHYQLDKMESIYNAIKVEEI